MRARMRLVTLYQTVHEALHSPSASSGGGTPKLIYAVNKDEAVLGIVRPGSSTRETKLIELDGIDEQLFGGVPRPPSPHQQKGSY